MSVTTAYDKPLIVEVCEGEVVIRAADGPTGFSLTPEAAARTAEQLVDAAMEAIEAQASQTDSLRL